MRTLYSYLTKQILVTLGLAMGVVVFAMLLWEAMRDVLSLLVSDQSGVGDMLLALALLVPFLLVFALPVGLLTSMLLVFGRFSADQELIAARANGISLNALVLPAIAIGLLFSGLSAWLNLEIAPKARVVYKQLLLKMGLEQSATLVSGGGYVDSIPGYSIYVHSATGNNMTGLIVYKFEDGEMVQHISAERGKLRVDQENLTAELELLDARVTMKFGNTSQSFTSESVTRNLDLRPLVEETRQVSLSNMTFSQLRAKIKELEEKGVETMPARVHLHRQVAWSFACFGFTLVGIPLGIRAHRRELLASVGMALILMVLYYGFIILGQTLETRPGLYPHLIVWIPNVLFQVVGTWLLFRANRGA